MLRSQKELELMRTNLRIKRVGLTRFEKIPNVIVFTLPPKLITNRA